MNNALYILNYELEFNRQEFEEFLIDYIYENKMFNLRNLLVTTTIERNVRHHPLRIAKEIGFDVFILQ